MWLEARRQLTSGETLTEVWKVSYGSQQYQPRPPPAPGTAQQEKNISNNNYSQWSVVSDDDDCVICIYCLDLNHLWNERLGGDCGQLYYVITDTGRAGGQCH